MGGGFNGNIVSWLADQRTLNQYAFSILDKELNVVTFSLKKGYYCNIAEIVDGLNETCLLYTSDAADE